MCSNADPIDFNEVSATAPALAVVPDVEMIEVAKSTDSKRSKRTRAHSLDYFDSSDGDDAVVVAKKPRGRGRNKAAKVAAPAAAAATGISRQRGKNTKVDSNDTANGVKSDSNVGTSKTFCEAETQTDSIVSMAASVESATQTISVESSESAVQTVFLESAVSTADKALSGSMLTCITALMTPMSSEVQMLQREMEDLKVMFAQMASSLQLLTERNSFSSAGVVSGLDTPSPRVAIAQSTAASLCAESTAHRAISAATADGAVTYAGATRKNASTPAHTRPAAGRQHQDAVAALYVDLHDKERRAANVVVSGLAADDTVPDGVQINNLFREELDLRVAIRRVQRIGRDSNNRSRPILVTLFTDTDANCIVENAKKLRKSSNPQISSKVFINPDLTRAEMQAAYEIRCQRRASRDGRSRTFFNNARLNADAASFSPMDTAAAEEETSTASAPPAVAAAAPQQ